MTLPSYGPALTCRACGESFHQTDQTYYRLLCAACARTNATASYNEREGTLTIRLGPDREDGGGTDEYGLEVFWDSSGMTTRIVIPYVACPAPPLPGFEFDRVRLDWLFRRAGGDDEEVTR